MGRAGGNEEKYQKTGNSEGQIAPGNPLFLGKQGRMEQIDSLTHTTPLTHRTTEQLQALGLTLGMAQLGNTREMQNVLQVQVSTGT